MASTSAEPEAKLPSAPKDDFADYRHPDDASFDKLVGAIDRAYHRPFVMMGRAFLHGMMSILGGTVGAAIIFVILFYILRSLNWAPYIEDFQKLIIPDKIEQILNGESAPVATTSDATVNALINKYLTDPEFRAQIDAQAAAQQK